MRLRVFTVFLSSLCAVLALPPTAASQQPAGDGAVGEDARAVVAIVDSALAFISAEDMEGYRDLMLDEALAFTVFEREGELHYRVRTGADERAMTTQDDWIERGYDPEVRVGGHLAQVWLPYDFYVDGEWSHCGVDAFILLRTSEGWRIAAIAWSIQQPPECRPHPEGSPGPEGPPTG